MGAENEVESSWPEYRRMVLAELERLNKGISDLHSKIDGATNQRISKNEIDIAMLQVKSGVWGAAAGLLVSLATVLMTFKWH